MIAALSTALLLATATHDIATTPSNTYSPDGLRVASGDTVRWQANGTHPLEFDGEPGGPYTSGTYQRVLTASVSFYCANHGGPGGVGMSGVVAVGDDNAAPSIAVVRETAAPVAGGSVAFRAVASDPERLPLRIDWDMDGDGSFERVGAGTSASATYDAGSRTVSARAVDDLGASAAASHAFEVPGAGTSAPPADQPPGNPPPVDSPLPLDTLPPTVSVSAPRSLTTGRLRRRGVRVRLTPSEDGRLVAELRARSGRRLARATAAAYAGEETVLRLRPRRVRAGRLTLRIGAIDAAGNRATVRRTLRVTRAR